MLGNLLDGRYRISYKLGQGGFGNTYVAQDIRRMDRQVVVKHLQPNSNNPNVLREAKILFDREAQTLADLGREHDQIPELLAYIEEDPEFYLVQEFVEGLPLSAEFSTAGRLTEAQVIEILKDVLEVLSFVHKKGVIHRDIKPSNLMRRQQDNKIVLIDFGAVKQINTLALDSQGKTIFSSVVGTGGYMPREQMAGRPRFSSDIYALGITAIQALTGVSPEQLEEDPKTDEVSWRNIAQISNKLAAILDKMVRSQWQNRYKTVEEVLQDLQNLGKPTKWQVPTVWRVFKPWYILAILTGIGTGFVILYLFFSPPTAVELVKEGNELIRQQNYESALGAFESATQVDSNLWSAWNGKGEALKALGRNEEALNAFESALKIKPDSFEVLNNQAETLFVLSRNDAAFNALEKAVKIKPNDPQVWYYRGVVLTKLQRHQEAIESFDKALEIKPMFPVALLGRGRVLYEFKQYQEAIESFEKALKIQPDLSAAWLGKGNALYELQNYESALTAFEDALKLEPNAAELWNRKGESLYKLQRYKEALNAFDEALRIQPDFTLAKINQQLARQQLND